MKNRYQGLVVVLFAAMLVGCASTKQMARIPNLAVPLEDTAKARIYVIRPSAFGGAIQMQVLDNDELIGKTGPGSYLCWERPPGNATITSKAENTGTVDLRAEAGKVYYVLQMVKMGALYARCRLEEIDEGRARKYLKECKIAKQAK